MNPQDLENGLTTAVYATANSSAVRRGVCKEDTHWVPGGSETLAAYRPASHHKRFCDPASTAAASALASDPTSPLKRMLEPGDAVERRSAAGSDAVTR
jgi:hypothetical protein